MDHIEDIYPLSPLQEGLLFHSLLVPGSGVYLTQGYWKLEGDLDPELLLDAWQRVVEFHPVLRTAFVWKRRDKPLQVVQRGIRIPWREEDWRHLAAVEQEARFTALLATDRAEGFDPAQAPLTRLTLVRTGARSWRLLWSYHHLLLDGWSAGLVLRNVLKVYSALIQGQQPDLAPCRPYRDFISWLRRRDPEAAQRFWHRQLSDFSSPTGLPGSRTPIRGGRPSQSGTAGEIEAHRHREVRMSAEETAVLQDLARRHRLTLSSIAKGAWSLILGHWSGRQDVVFGEVVAGRPHDLEGFEGMVGLFINTVPVRVRLDPAAELLPWLEGLQRQHAEMREFEHSPLIEVQACSGVLRGEPLFETLLVFDNFPVASRGGADGAFLGFDIRDAGGVDQNSYPMTMTVWPTAEMGLEINTVNRRAEPAIAEQILAQFGDLLRAFVERPEAALRDLLGTLAGAGRRHLTLAEERLATLSRGRLQQIRPRPVRAAGAGSLVRTERLALGFVSPLKVSPEVEDVDVLGWVSEQSDLIREELLRCGALLFRGFGLKPGPELDRLGAVLCGAERDPARTCLFLPAASPGSGVLLADARGALGRPGSSETFLLWEPGDLLLIDDSLIIRRQPSLEPLWISGGPSSHPFISVQESDETYAR